MVTEAIKLPNRTHLDTPVGGEDDNIVLEEVGTKKIAEPDTELPSHLEIG